MLGHKLRNRSVDLNGVDLVLESMFQVAVLCQLCETQIEVVIFLHSSLTKIVFSGFDVLLYSSF